MNDTQEQITQAFDNIVNAAWEGAKSSDSAKLSQKRCYELIDEIQKQISALQAINYSRAMKRI